MNKVVLIGRLSKDIELRYTTNNKAVANTTIAVNRVGTDGTDFIDIVVWDKQAENLSKYQKKGNLIAVFGELRTEKYSDKNGQNRYKTYVICTMIDFLEHKKENNSQNNQVSEQPNMENNNETVDPFKEFGEEISKEQVEIQFPESELPF